MKQITITIDENDLEESTIESAVAAGKDPLEMFEEQLETVAEWSQWVHQGDNAGAVAYAVGEIIRTADNVDGSNTVDSAVDSELDRTESGGFDLREKTKL